MPGFSVQMERSRVGLLQCSAVQRRPEGLHLSQSQLLSSALICVGPSPSNPPSMGPVSSCSSSTFPISTIHLLGNSSAGRHHSPSLRGLMASNWRRSLGNVRSFIGNSMGGLRGPTNLASWVVAGTLAYFLWVKPSQDLHRQQQERAALASPDPNSYVEKRKPIPDPQNNGLIYGNKNKPLEKDR